MNWLYEVDDCEIELDDNFSTEDCFGFIYKITNKKTGKFYIGKKSFIHNKTKKLGKNAIANLPVARGRKLTKVKEQVDSGWKEYYGSSKELLSDIKQYGKDNFKRLILDFCDTKKQLTYAEVFWQMKERVLFIDSYNISILGRFYRKDFV